jgi:hypothetical protein
MLGHRLPDETIEQYDPGRDIVHTRRLHAGLFEGSEEEFGESC